VEVGRPSRRTRSTVIDAQVIDPPDGDEGDGSPPAGDGLSARLAAAWNGKNWSDFFCTASLELGPKIHRKLVSKGLTQEDAADCVSDVLESLLKRRGDANFALDNPHAYIWKSAHHAAYDLISEKKLEARNLTGVEVGHRHRAEGVGRVHHPRRREVGSAAQGDRRSGDGGPVSEAPARAEEAAGATAEGPREAARGHRPTTRRAEAPRQVTPSEGCRPGPTRREHAKTDRPPGPGRVLI
jgi:DNA-directed RNA polymerase specialized sigma24 family protein